MMCKLAIYLIAHYTYLKHDTFAQIIFLTSSLNCLVIRFPGAQFRFCRNFLWCKAYCLGQKIHCQFLSTYSSAEFIAIWKLHFWAKDPSLSHLLKGCLMCLLTSLAEFISINTWIFRISWEIWPILQFDLHFGLE